MDSRCLDRRKARRRPRYSLPSASHSRVQQHVLYSVRGVHGHYLILLRREPALAFFESSGAFQYVVEAVSLRKVMDRLMMREWLWIHVALRDAPGKPARLVRVTCTRLVK